ncbi:MAG: hypothetical protein JW772_03960, partial [Candidatus Diapherotrites archaeon]|nr:hypothetical protein [Candidatus Diapherotrites archaeon]
KNIPVNIVGEGGVGFVEAMRATKKSNDDAIAEFEKRLSGKKFAVTYDHPGYAGLKEIELAKKILLAAQDSGFKISTMKEIAEKAI